MQNIKSGFTCGESSLCQNFAKFQNAMKKIVEYQLKKLSIGGQIANFGEKLSSSFNYYKRRE